MKLALTYTAFIIICNIQASLQIWSYVLRLPLKPKHQAKDKHKKYLITC